MWQPPPISGRAKAAGRSGSLTLYYFHLCDGGDSIIDAEGQDVADPAMISGAAMREARSIISHEALLGEINFHCAIEVRDEAGALVHELQFRDAVTIFS